MLHYKSNLTKVRSSNRKEFLKTKGNNFENVRELNKNAQIRKIFQSSELHTTDHELVQPARKKQNFTVADRIHDVIQSFHDTCSFACIKCGPEYISVIIINTVHKVHNNLTDICITGKAGVDNMHLVSSTCHSNLPCLVKGLGSMPLR